MKQKTKKAASKRFSFRSSGNVKRRKIGQAHFNARATGDTTRKKHPDKKISSSDAARIVRLLPYK